MEAKQPSHWGRRRRRRRRRTKKGGRKPKEGSRVGDREGEGEIVIIKLGGFSFFFLSQIAGKTKNN